MGNLQELRTAVEAIQQNVSDELQMQLSAFEHQYVACFDLPASGTDLDGLSEKADRVDIWRLDAELRTLSEPLQRLSRRTVGDEAKTAALERKVESLEIAQAAMNMAGDRDLSTSAEVAVLGARLDVVAKEHAELAARILDVEDLVEENECTRLNRLPNLGRNA